MPARALRMLDSIDGLHGLTAELDGARVPIESSWGTAHLERGEPLLAPLGPPIRLDPTRLARAVEQRAVGRGAQRVAAELDALEEVAGGWELRASDWSGTARFVVDASGRARIVAGVRGAAVDTECEQWAHVARFRESAGSSLLVEATPDGWWYTSPLGDGTAIGVYVTDDASLPVDLDDALAETVHVGRRLRARCGAVRTVDASVERASMPCGRRWAAVGSAALALDPLAGAGTSTAIAQGSRMAEAVAACLHGRPDVLGHYARMLDARWADHVVQRRRVYAIERRWVGHRFWRRRAGTDGSAHSGNAARGRP